MRDSLEFFFRQRFRGHEAPVEPGTWEAIQGKLMAGAPAPDQSALEDLFRERFQGHEMHVDPSVWGNISGQIGHGVAAGTTAGNGIFGGLGWVAAGFGVVALVGGLYYFAPEDRNDAVAINSDPSPTELRTEVAPEPSTISNNWTTDAASPSENNAISEVERPVQNSGSSHIAATIPEKSNAEATVPVDRSAGSVELIEPNEITPSKGEELVQRIITDLTEQVKEDVLSGTDRSTVSEGMRSQPRDGSIEPMTSVDQDPEVRHDPVLFLQNTFTPNGDGINDEYRVSSDGFGRMMIKVFSVKNNQLVFSTSTNEPWTGHNCEDGYYLLAVEAMTVDGRLLTKGQVVWLNRNPLN